MPLSAGDRIGPYEILEPIGKGGMGEVWKARDTRLDRIVAIKTSNQQFSERFEREARAVAALNHPNICILHDVAPDYLVMEFVEGAPLKGPLPLEEVLRVGRLITSALEAAHEKGITHRDLKPGNILMKPDGTVKVLDFGLAKIGSRTAASGGDPEFSPTISMAATQAGVILGTAAYMAPEQAKGKDVDKRADIWAFGVVLYELTTGSRPFHGDDMSEILASVIKEHPTYEPVPHELRRLLKKCLEKDPAKRLRDIGDVWELLEAPAATHVAPAVVKQKSVLPWVIAAAMTLAVAGLAYVAAPHFSEAPPRLVKLEFPAPEKGGFNTTNGPLAVSPDGRRVAFRAALDGKSRLWVRDLDSLEARMLPDTESPSNPFWAPDSRRVAFLSRGKLMKMDVTGGPATVLATSPSLRGGSWNQDDVILLGNSGSVLLRVPSAGGTPTPVTELDKSRNETAHWYPRFLPDGHHFLYLARSSDAAKSAIFAGDLQSKDKKLVLQLDSNALYVEPPGGAGAGYLLFVRDRTLMAQVFDPGKLETTGDAMPIAEKVDVPLGSYGNFGASREGTLVYTAGGSGAALQMTWYDRSGKVVGALGKPVDVQLPRVSPNGKMVVVDRLEAGSQTRDLWLYDLVRGTEQRLTFAGVNQFPVWSPDGTRVAYVQGQIGPEAKVVMRTADGTGQEEVLEKAFKAPTDWTRDGGYLVSMTPTATPGTQNDLWSLTMSKTGEHKPSVLRQTEFNEGWGRVSPDGRWLAYQSSESNRTEVYVMGFPSLSGHWQISVDGGSKPAWSRDGHELYFVGANNKMMAVQIQSSATFQAGVPQSLFDVRLGPGNANYDVAPDGRFLIATPVEQAAPVPMTVVLNWQAALKK